MCIRNHQGNVDRMPIGTRRNHSEKHWYVIRTIGRRENKVKEYIDSMIRTDAFFAGYVSQVLVPTEKVENVRNGRIIVTKKPLISGYVYVEADLVEKIKSMLCSVPNVLGFLTYSRSDYEPMPLSPREVKQLFASIGERSGLSNDFTVPYCIGDQIMITGGPFSGFNAFVEDVDRGRKKLKASVTIFGGKTPMELKFGQAVKI